MCRVGNCPTPRCHPASSWSTPIGAWCSTDVSLWTQACPAQGTWDPWDIQPRDVSGFPFEEGQDLTDLLSVKFLSTLAHLANQARLLAPVKVLRDMVVDQRANPQVRLEQCREELAAEHHILSGHDAQVSVGLDRQHEISKDAR